MKNTIKTILFFLIVGVQALIIIFLSVGIYTDFRISRSYVVNEIDADAIQTVEESRYENFYEFNTEHFERDKETLQPVDDPVAPSHTSAGFRERFIYPLEAKDNTIRIIALGDSNTYGLGVRIEDVFTEVFEDLLNKAPLCTGNKYEVINLGVPGYDLLYAEERFRLRGAAYKPDAVLWFLYPNDFTEYKDEQLRLTYEIIEAGKRDEYAGDVGEYTTQQVREMYEQDYIEDVQLTALHMMSEYYAGNIILFSGHRYLNSIQHLKLNAVVTKNNNTFSFFPFDEIPRQHFLDNGHANEEGHNFIAQALYSHFAAHPELLPECGY